MTGVDRPLLVSLPLLRVQEDLVGVRSHSEVDHRFVLLTLVVPGSLESDGELTLLERQIGSQRNSHVKRGVDSGSEVLLSEGAESSHLGVLHVVDDRLGLDLHGVGVDHDGGVGGHDDRDPVVEVERDSGHGGHVGEVMAQVQHLHEVSIEGNVSLGYLLTKLAPHLLEGFCVH